MSRRSREASILSLTILSLALASCSEADPDPPAGSRQLSIDTSGGAELDAIEAGQSDNVAVLSHGATGTKEDFFGLAGVFAERGWRAIAYDARSEAREADLRAVVAYARETGATSVVLVGGSLGASLSISMAAELQVQAVVSLSASAGSFDALQAAEAIGDSIPVLVAVAEENEPYATDAHRIAGALGITPTIVTGGGHGAGVFRDHPEFMDTVVTFADEAVDRAELDQA